MLDLSFVRSNLDLVASKLRERGQDSVLLDEFRTLDEDRRRAITESEQLKARSNELSKRVAELAKMQRNLMAHLAENTELALKASNISQEVQNMIGTGQDPKPVLMQIQTLLTTLLRNSENLGSLNQFYKDAEAAKVEGRKLQEHQAELESVVRDLDGKTLSVLARIPNLTRDDVPVGSNDQENVERKRWGVIPEFSFKPKPHWELGAQLGILDTDRAAKISGSRFAVYWGDGAR
jgi:seryl-tRNA synthetase